MTQEATDWLALNREEIVALIEEGLAAQQRGELFSEEQVREWMEQSKQAWTEVRKANRG